MTKRTDPPKASDEQVRALLERHKCRRRSMGSARGSRNIATPSISASPISVVEDLRGGELPEFDNLDEARELIAALVSRLWNRPPPIKTGTRPSA